MIKQADFLSDINFDCKILSFSAHEVAYEDGSKTSIIRTIGTDIKPEFSSVYAELEDGRSMWIMDCEDKPTADSMVQLITSLLALATPEIIDAEEVGRIAVIISDHYMEDLYKEMNSGYMDAVDYIKDIAMEFYRRYKEIDWEDVLINGHRDFPSCAGWDEAIVTFSYQQMKNKGYNVRYGMKY